MTPERHTLLFAILCTCALPVRAETPSHWPLDTVVPSVIVRGAVTTATGAVKQCLVLDGSSLLELPGSAASGMRATCARRFTEPWTSSRFSSEP